MGVGLRRPLDLDHVVTGDGLIYRVVGNLDSRSHFLGYNVYSPNSHGDRYYRGVQYKKNFIEDERLPADVLDVYRLIKISEIVEHHDPIDSVYSNAASFRSTIWFDLYRELRRIFGPESVGIFGSSMFGLHLTPDGKVRKDIDFVIDGIENTGLLRQELPGIRKRLGFSEVSMERQLRQYERYRRIFRNENNSIRSIVARRWTSLQLSEEVVTTIRLRDPASIMPVDIVRSGSERPDTVISGRVSDSDGSNLFPRIFELITETGRLKVCILWWKFSTPVRDGDQVTLCGTMILTGNVRILRLTNYSRHWLRIDDQ